MYGHLDLGSDLKEPDESPRSEKNATLRFRFADPLPDAMVHMEMRLGCTTHTTHSLWVILSQQAKTPSIISESFESKDQVTALMSRGHFYCNYGPVYGLDRSVEFFGALLHFPSAKAHSTGTATGLAAAAAIIVVSIHALCWLHVCFLLLLSRYFGFFCCVKGICSLLLFPKYLWP